MKGLIGADAGGPPLAPAEAAAEQVKRGVAALGANRFDEAVGAFHEAVRLEPGSASNHVNLAFALQQTDAEHGALRHLREAVMLDLKSFDAQYMLGGALDRSGEAEEAIEHLRKAVELRPEFEAARIELCRLLAASGKLDDARSTIETALSLNPENADIHHYLGNLCMTENKPEAAIASYERALSLQPAYTQVHSNMGLALNATRQHERAAQSFEAALKLDPAFREAHFGLAATRKAQGRYLDAIECLQHSSRLDPDHVDTVNELGGVALDLGDFGRAIHYFERVVAQTPNKPNGYLNLGIALVEIGDIERGMTVYRQGLAVKPIASLHDNLGVALMRLGFADESIVHFRKAIELDPGVVGTRLNLAVALTDAVGQADGIAAYREILALDPSQLQAHSNLLFNLTYSQTCSPEEYLAEVAAFDAKLTRQASAPSRPFASSSADRRLRVGFVSGDLLEHPVGYFIDGILHELDQTRFELFAYATVPKHDALTSRIKPRFAAWRLLNGLTNEAAAQLIRDDGIDVLIDLAGHTANNRLPMFALRPAPLQVSWLGYFGTTGVSEIDFILVDEGCVPHGSERFLSERPWRLPHTWLCYTPPSDGVAPPVAALPALSNGHMTFGCFQRMSKINDSVLAAWGRIFEALPQARLTLQSQQYVSAPLVNALLGRLNSVGIANDRVDARPTLPVAAYLASYADVDICLDTFPFNGGTTTCEALWMGVPTLTIAGDSMLARQGAALLQAGGLPDWIALDVDDYVDKAIKRARDINALAALRTTLRDQMRHSPLFDTRRFARDFEQSLVGMWQQKMSEVVVGPTV